MCLSRLRIHPLARLPDGPMKLREPMSFRAEWSPESWVNPAHHSPTQALQKTFRRENPFSMDTLLTYYFMAGMRGENLQGARKEETHTFALQ